jgi:hypothetical protein
MLISTGHGPKPFNIEYKGRAIAQAVSRPVPTAAARVRAEPGHMEFVVDKVSLG